MKTKKAFLRVCLLIMAVLSLSLLSVTVYAAGNQTQNDENSAVQSSELTENEYALLKGDITAKTILIAAGVSIAATGITVFLIWHGYKTNGQSEPYTYKKNAPLELTKSEDVHVDTIVNRRKIERNDN